MSKMTTTPEEVAALVSQGLSIGPCVVSCSGRNVGVMHVRVDALEPVAARHIEGVSAWLTSRVPAYLCVDIVADRGSVHTATRVYGDRWCQASVVDGRVVSTHAPQFNRDASPSTTSR
jgi:hypothetical protein